MGTQKFKRIAMQNDPALEVIVSRTLNPKKPAMVVWDLHGTIFLPNWEGRMRAAYKELFGQEPTQDWMEQYVYHKSTREIVAKMAADSNRSIEDVSALYRRVTKRLNETEIPQVRPHVENLIHLFHQRGIPQFFTSGTARPIAKQQLEAAGLLKYIPFENLLCGVRSSTRYVRAAVIGSLHRFYPDHTIALFDDNPSKAFEAVDNIGGIGLGVPQLYGRFQEKFRNELIDHKAHYVLQGFESWEKIAELLTPNPAVQTAAPKATVAKGPAKLMSVLPTASRPNSIPLKIKVSPDLEHIDYHLVLSDEGVFRHDGEVDFTALRTEFLARIPSSHLITPQRYIENSPELSSAMRKLLLELLAKQKRYTEFRDLIVSWDREVDVNVWTFNIDTGYLFNAALATQLLTDPSIKVFGEVGVGGGLSFAGAAKHLPHLRMLVGTDISAAALRTTVLAVQPHLRKGIDLRMYWGKGFRALKERWDGGLLNPPYIPSAPFMQTGAWDAFRGTGLIREAVEFCPKYLNTDNPNARLLMSISSMAFKDLEKYEKEFKDRTKVIPVGESLEVPLKIGAVDESWISWLVQEGGLRQDSGIEPWKEPYFHTLQTFELRPK